MGCAGQTLAFLISCSTAVEKTFLHNFRLIKNAIDLSCSDFPDQHRLPREKMYLKNAAHAEIDLVQSALSRKRHWDIERNIHNANKLSFDLKSKTSNLRKLKNNNGAVW